MISRWIDWAGVVVLCACAILAGLLEMLLVPLYAGASIVPVTVVFAIASNIALPLLARRLVPRTLAAGLPFLAWLLVVVVVGLMARPEGDVILPGGGGLQWVSYGVVLGGALAGTVTVVWTSTPRRTGRPPGARPRPVSR